MKFKHFLFGIEGFVLGVLATILFMRTPHPPGILLEVPVLRQITKYSCGASALASALGYYGKERRESEIMQEVGANPKDGTPMDALVKAAENAGLQAAVHYDFTVDKLREIVDGRQIAIVDLQAWHGSPTDYTNQWDDGHYVVLIGVDSQRIYFMDPAILGGRGSMPLKEFETRWHDEDRDGVRHQHTVIALNGTPNPPAIWQTIE
jgi:predicted double-glycine peptidase